MRKTYSPLASWLFLAVIASYGVYLLQMFTPLRMTTDSLEYLSVAASAADGHGFRFLGQSTQHPPGYAGMLACLDRMGIARPWSLVGLNCGFLALGLVATYAVSRRAFALTASSSLLACLLTLLSFPIVKHTTLVLSDIPYFGLSMASVAMLVSTRLDEGRFQERATRLLLTVTLVAAAILTRTIGLTLLLPLFWIVMRLVGLDVRLRSDKRLLVGSVLGLGVVFLIGLELFSRSMYGNMFKETYASAGLLQTWMNTTVLRMKELGELTLNIPATKVPSVGHVSWLVGLAVIVLLGSSLYHRRQRFGAADIYLIACLAGLLLTPWSEVARYWIPVLPIAIVALIAQLDSWWEELGLLRFVIILACSCYVVMGLMALGYSTRITFSGVRFPEIYGRGSAFAPAYRLYLLQQPPMPGEQVDPEVLRVLRRFAGPPMVIQPQSSTPMRGQEGTMRTNAPLR